MTPSWVAMLSVLLVLLAVVTSVGLVSARALRIGPERGAAAAPRATARVVGAAVAILSLGTAGLLWARAAVLTGQPLGEALTLLPAVLGRSHFGAMWLAGTADIALLWWSWLRWRRTGTNVYAALMLAALGIYCATFAATGHAAGWGDLSWALLVDWLHVMAGCIWGGGMVALALATWAARKGPPGRQSLIADAMRASRLALLGVLLVLATGIGQILRDPSVLAEPLASGYARTLLLKLSLVAVMLACGALNRFVFLRAMSRHPNLPPRGLVRVLMLELAMMVAVLACVATLREITPRPAMGAHLEAPRG